VKLEEVNVKNHAMWNRDDFECVVSLLKKDLKGLFSLLIRFIREASFTTLFGMVRV